MFGVSLPGAVALHDFLPRDLTGCILFLPQADASFHPLYGGVAQLLYHLAGLGKVGVKTAEVDTVLQREDIGLVVQLKSQLFELLPNESQRLAGRLHVRADHIPVVHIHPGQRQMQLFADIVHDEMDIEHGVDMARLVSQGQSLVYLVYVLPHERLEALVRETLGQNGLEPVVVDALEEMPDVALDNCAVGVVPFLHRSVR